MTILIYADSVHDLKDARVEGEKLWLDGVTLEKSTGWEIKPEGICRDEICVAMYDHPELLRDGRAGSELDLAGFAHLIHQPFASDEALGTWYFGPTLDERRGAMLDLRAPDFTLPDLAGKQHSLSDQRGKKVVLALWASYCGCRLDQPMWQLLHDELKDKNFEVVSVACESRGADAAREWIEAAKPDYPSVIDTDHRVPELYNTRNVPAVFWIDEDGTIVRGNDPIYVIRRNRETGETTINEKYLNAVRDWVAKGPNSIYVTDAAETQRRVGEPDEADSHALAEFRLGLNLYRAGHPESAIEHFKKAHELKPDNWNYKRQAWNLGDIERDYGTTIRDAVTGPIPFYPPLELPDPE